MLLHTFIVFLLMEAPKMASDRSASFGVAAWVAVLDVSSGLITFFFFLEEDDFFFSPVDGTFFFVFFFFGVSSSDAFRFLGF